jgi:hypothetical protein
MKTKDKPNALTFDVLTRSFGPEYILDAKGTKGTYEGRDLVVVKRKPDGSIEPYSLPTEIDTTPEDFYHALSWKEVAVIYVLNLNALERLNLALMATLAGCFLFGIFLLVMGSKPS